MKNILDAVVLAFTTDSKQNPIRHEIVMLCLFMAVYVVSFTSVLLLAAMCLWLYNQLS